MDNSIEIFLPDLLESLPDSLTWEWDGRFEGALTAFQVAEQDSILTILGARFSESWDSSTVGDAPDNITRCMQGFGGVADGQLVFATDPVKKVVLLGLWWPWSNGSDISLRLIPYAPNLPAGESENTLTLLRTALAL